VIIITGYLCGDGLNIYLFATDATTGVLQEITGVTSQPTISDPGVELPVVATTFWRSVAQDDPFVILQLEAALPATASLAFSAPAGWCTTADGAAPAATNQPLGNYSGGQEPGVGGFMVGGVFKPMPPLAIPAKPTIQIGYNASWGAQGQSGSYYSLLKNSIHRGYWTGVTLDQYARPVTMTSAPVGRFLGNALSNGVDNRGIPAIPGVYTYVYNELNPTNPTPIAISISAPTGGATLTNPSGRIAGHVVNGIEYDVQYQFTLSYPAPAVSYAITIVIEPTSPTGSYPYPWTIQNDWLVPPNAKTGQAQLIERTDPYDGLPGRFAIDENALAWCSEPPFAMRYNDTIAGYDNLSSVRSPADLRNASDYQYLASRTLSATLSQAENYNLATNPQVWLADDLPGTLPIPGGPAPYAITPPEGSISYITFSGPTTGWVTGLLATAKPHGFATGQLAQIQVGNIIYTNGPSATQSVSTWCTSPVFVTGPNSFAYTCWGGPTTAASMPGGINNVASTQTITGSVSVSVPDAGSIPWEAAAAFSQAVGAAHYLNIPILANDAAVTAIGNRTASSYVGAGLVLCETGNETWSSPEIIICQAFGALGALDDSPAGWINYYVEKAARNWSLIAAAFGTRANQVQFVLCGQWTAPGICAAQVAKCNAMNAANPGSAPLYGYGIAPYPDINMNDPSMLVAVETWSRKQWLKLAEHHLRYNVTFNTGSLYYQGFQAALKAYVPTAGQPAGFVPALFCYEYAVQILGTNVSQQQTVDLDSDPERYWLEIAMILSLEYQGVSFANRYCLGMGMQPVCLVWGAYEWAGQQPGYGANNVFGGGWNGFTNTRPGAQAIIDWQKAAAAA
jgi:hypothetical protein